MGQIPKAAWDSYVEKLAVLDKRASEEMRQYIMRNGYGDIDSMIEYAYALSTKYGEGAATLAATLYDNMAEAEGVNVKPAEPAYPADYHTVAKTVQGISDLSYNIDLLSNAVGRLVKQAGADTMLLNAERDEAEYAWIPTGDTCPYCLLLASYGWQKASKASLKGGRARHIHANCDCTYAVRQKGGDDIPGYDPKKYQKMFDDTPGGTNEDKINIMRREQYEKLKESGEKELTPSQQAFKTLNDTMKANNLEHLKVGKFENPLSEEDIIERLCGGDRTKGSCSSLALAYAGNKAGYDVLDFRGGDSQAVFSRRSNIGTIAEALGGKTVKSVNDFTGAGELLKTVKEGHEYYLVTGGHAAIVRKTENGMEFLELQSAVRNGWKPLDRDALRYRFGCKTSHSNYGTKYELTNTLIDIDNVKNHESEFANLMGYINTESGKQLKGMAGHER